MKKTALFFVFFSLLFFAAPAKAFAAHFELSPQNLTINDDTEFNVNLYLNTGGKLINAIDALLNFPQSLLEVKEISFSSRFPTNIKSFDNSTGKIEIHSAAFSVGDISSSNGTVATVKFKSKAEGTASVYFTCNPGQTTDSNILESGTSNDIIDCGANKGGEYKIEEEAEPTATPTPTPSDCKAPIEPTSLTGKPGPDAGQVTLTWTKILNADYYTISYGLSSKNYIYGVPNTGNTDNFTISRLTPAKTYYFAITAVNECGSSGHSNQVAIQAMPGTTYVYVRSEPTPAPSSTPTSSPTPTIKPQASPTSSPSASPSLEPIPTDEPTPSPEPQPSAFKDFLKYAALGFLIFIIVLAVIKTLTGGGGKTQINIPEEGEPPPEGGLTPEDTELPPE
jgi:hypothetical protein